MLVVEQDKRVLATYAIFKRLMRKYSKQVSFPKHTDPRKTYTWRYITNFIQRVDDMNLGEGAVDLALVAVVEEAKRTSQLYRGIALLDYKDLFELCKKKLEKESQDVSQMLLQIKQCHNFLLKQCNGQPPFEMLTKRQHRMAYANLTRWYQAGYLTTAYVTISCSCKKAMGTLSQSELGLFPGPMELLKARLLLISNSFLLPHLRELLGDDLCED